MRADIEASLRKLQPVNGTLFPTRLISEDAERSDRSIWIVETDSAYSIDCQAVDWVQDLLRQYIYEQLSADGFVVDVETLSIMKEENDAESIAETNFDAGFQRGIDGGDSRELGRG